MELNYKAYQKIKIYLDKIQSSHENLVLVLNRMPFSNGAGPIKSRIKELELMKALLCGFCLNLRTSLPYVPSCRCKAFTSWYGDKALFEPNDLSSFKENLMQADNEVLWDAAYAILSDVLPPALRDIFVKHTIRYRKIRQSLDLVLEDPITREELFEQP